LKNSNEISTSVPVPEVQLPTLFLLLQGFSSRLHLCYISQAFNVCIWTLSIASCLAYIRRSFRPKTDWLQFLLKTWPVSIFWTQSA